MATLKTFGDSTMNAARLLSAITGSVTVLALLAQAPAQAQVQTPAPTQQAACSALAEWAGGPGDLRIVEARFYTDRSVGGPGGGQTLPPHCHVTGSFEHRTGIDDVEYAIGFAINLPEDWNGRFLFQGGGGLNGAVREPVGAGATGGRSALARGFAVVSTDSGHTGSGFDSSFMADQLALLNFQFLANAKTTEVARPIVEAYYGSAPHHSYFVGCSTGGREGMIMAQRYPHLFDGIVSGAPAMRTTISNLALRWISNQYVRAGVSNPREPFAAEERALIMGALMDSCDALDGLEDGLIFNRTSCDFDPRALACSANPGRVPGQQCLVDAKAEALARAMAGPVNAAGMPVYVSFPYDSGIDDTGGLPGLLIAGGSPPVGGSGADMSSQDVDAEFMAALVANEALGATAWQFNVSTFIEAGGKQMFYHGEADPWFSANDTVRYFDAMRAANNDVAAVDQYSRLYLVPGMAHCAGGEQTVDTFDLLTPIVEWVENGNAPGAVTATGASMPGQSRLLCPYPSYAHFEGGDAANAGDYACRMP
jgi:pimeloyl-ACP methyl ester carboxylesterase